MSDVRILSYIRCIMCLHITGMNNLPARMIYTTVQDNHIQQSCTSTGLERLLGRVEGENVD